MGEWINAADKLPEDEDFVLVAVSGQYGNIRFLDAIELAQYFQDDGWELELFPEWENPGVTHWMPLPTAPAQCGMRNSQFGIKRGPHTSPMKWVVWGEDEQRNERDLALAPGREI